VAGAVSWPEVQIPPGSPPGMQLLTVHVPDVVECRPVTQSHWTVVPTVIVVVSVPLTESTKVVPPPCPTNTMRFGFVVGVRVAVGVTVKVRVGVLLAVCETVELSVREGVNVNVGVRLGVNVRVAVKVGVMLGVREFVGVFEIVNVCVAVNVFVGESVRVWVGVMVGVKGVPVREAVNVRVGVPEVGERVRVGLDVDVRVTVGVAVTIVPPVVVRVGEGPFDGVRVMVGGMAGPSLAPTTKMGSVVALSMTAA
jgi:hypothetical protein